MKTRLICISLVFGLTLLGNTVLAQVPIISYTAPAPYTVGVAIPNLLPNTSGGPVAAFAFGAGVSLSGATLSNPYGMGVDPSGNIYVVNYGNNTVSEYNSAGTFISNGFFNPGTSSFSNPAGITFDASGNAYILNYNHTNNGNGNSNGNAYVDEYSSSGALVKNVIEGMGTAHGKAIVASSNLDAAECNTKGVNNTVSQFSTSGGLAFSTTTNTANPVAVAVDGSGNIYALDNTNNNVVEFNSSGTYVSTIIPTTGIGWTLVNPNAIWIDGAGNIYVGDSGTGGTTGSVRVFNSAGTLLTTISGLTDPRGLVTDSKGNLYVSDYTNGTVKKYPPVGGYVLSGTLPAGLSFNNVTGAFTGTPTSAFNTTLTVYAYNASGSGSTTVTLSCPATSAPTISYAPNTVNVYTENSSITPLNPSILTGAPVVSIVSSSGGGLPTGLSINSSTGAITGTPTVLSAATIYTVTATNSFGSVTTKISIATVVDDFWIGTGTTSDWNNAGNWSTGAVPGPTDFASIGVEAYGKHGVEPQLAANTTATAYLVTFGSLHSATLTINNGATFTINNSLTISKNATVNFSGIGTTGTGAINFAPAAVLTVKNTGTLIINSPLTVTLQSNATGSASVDRIRTGGIIIGTVSVQRYFQGSGTFSGGRYVERNYRILSPPVYNATVTGNNVYGLNYIVGSTAGLTTTANSTTNSIITGCTGGSTAAGNPSIYLYREDLTPSNASFTAGNYIGITNITNSSTTGASDGTIRSIPVGNSVFFFFRGNATNWAGKTTSPFVAPENTTLTATGTLNQGSITVNDWFKSSGLSYTVGSPVAGFNMVGNPYASSIDWNTSNTAVVTNTGIVTTNISSSIYFFNPVTGNFDTYQTTGASSGLSTGNGSNIIASGQGFFVLATGASPTLQFTESAKIPLSQDVGSGLLMDTKAPQVAVQQVVGLKMVTDSSNYDDIMISFNSTASPKFNTSEDAIYVAGTSAMEGLSSLSEDNVKLSINTLPLPAQSSQIIKLNVTAVKSGQYTFQRTALKAIPQIYDVWLMDNYKKDSLDIRNNSTYSFNVDLSNPATFGNGRFTLVIRQNPALGVHLLNFTAAKTTGGAETVWKTENEQNYTNFTVERSTDGGTTFNVLGGFASSALGTYSFLDNNPVTTTTDEYRLKIEDLNGAITYSKVVTLMYANPNNQTITSNISVYPNPTSGKVNLAINQTTGTPSFSIMIMNNLGAMVKTATSAQPTWETDVTQLVPGTYFIQVMNKNDNTLVGKSTFVKL